MNNAGIYVVQLYVDGKVQDVVLDDLLPCNPETGLPLFATATQDGEIWPCLLEKAWAKLHRSYCMIRLSPPTVCLAALTLGRPFKVLDHNEMKAESILRKIARYQDKEHIVLSCFWDNQYEDKVNGRLASVCGTVDLVKSVTKDTVNSMPIQDYQTKYRLTIRVKKNLKQSNVT